MTGNISALSLGLCGIALSGAAALAQAPSSQPKTAALCLPPGATAPVACGTARAGQTIRLLVATTDLPTGPIDLLFAEEAAPGTAPRTASLTIPPTRSRDGSYDVDVPRELCGPGRGAGMFEIQRITKTFSEEAVTPHSLGTLTVAC
jgi:hypothetical protein